MITVKFHLDGTMMLQLKIIYEWEEVKVIEANIKDTLLMLSLDVIIKSQGYNNIVNYMHNFLN